MTKAICALPLLLIPSFSAMAGVIVDGKDWFQPASFLDLSWNDIAGACNSTTGSCSGSLNGVNVTGATWASVAEVNDLFNSFLPSPELGPGPDIFSEIDSLWAPDILTTFVPTLSGLSGFDAEVLAGFVRDTVGAPPSAFRFALVQDGTAATGEFSEDFLVTLFTDTNPEAPVFAVGAFLYTPAQVPEPMLSTLLILGLGGLGLTRYRRRRLACL